MLVQRILKLQAEHPSARLGPLKLCLSDHARTRHFTLEKRKKHVPCFHGSESESSCDLWDDSDDYLSDNPDVVEAAQELEIEDSLQAPQQEQRDSALAHMFSKRQSWVTQLRLELASTPPQNDRADRSSDDEDVEDEKLAEGTRDEVYAAPWFDLVQRPVPKHRLPLRRAPSAFRPT